jgi:hypothetical protein
LNRTSPARIALLYPGDREMRRRSDRAESRFAALFEALAAAGLDAAPAVYNDDFAQEVEAQLLDKDAVLVWSNPIEGGRRRDVLDAMLRRVAAAGVLVSSHPDAVLALGTKDVLLAASGLPFGSDVHRIDSLAQLEAELPARLQAGPRVLKQYRGHSGIGVWRVEAASPAPLRLRVRHAQRGSEEEETGLDGLKDRLASYFDAAGGGHMIDQAWQPRMIEGMVRAYLVGDRVAGFGLQALNALHPDALPGPRLYHDADLPECRQLKAMLESEWIDMLLTAAGLPRDRVPLLWDCDFLRGSSSAAESWVLCEVNVSSVSPFPPSAIPRIVEALSRATQAR